MKTIRGLISAGIGVLAVVILAGAPGAHADVVTDKPGKCPMCDMDLVATSTVSQGKIAEENWRRQHSVKP